MSGPFHDLRYRRDHLEDMKIADQIRDPLLIGRDIPRVQTNFSSHDLEGSLDLAMIASIYQKGHFSSRITVHSELTNPPKDIELINHRQKLVELLLSDQQKLADLEAALAAAKNVGCNSNYWDINDLDKIEVMEYVLKTQAIMDRVLKYLPAEDVFAKVHEQVDAMRRSTNLDLLVADWHKLNTSAEAIRLDYKTGKLLLNDSRGHAIALASTSRSVYDIIEYHFIERANAVLTMTNPFVEALHGCLHFYASLARFALNLKEQKFPCCFPQLTAKAGSIHASGFYNPLLGLEEPREKRKNDRDMRSRGIIMCSHLHDESDYELLRFPENMCPHDYDSQGSTTNIVLGRNAGSKTTYVTGRGLIQLMAQIGSVVPASSCELGVIDSVGLVYIHKVEIGAGQSTFTTLLDCFGEVLDLANDRALVLLDDATEGTDEDNANSFMDFILEKLREKKATSYISSQQRRLATADSAAHATIYTTTPRTYYIMPKQKDQPVETVCWQETAKNTALKSFLE